MGVICKGGIRGGGGGKGPVVLASTVISRQSVVKQGFQKTNFPMILELETFFAIDLVNVNTPCKISDL